MNRYFSFFILSSLVLILMGCGVNESEESIRKKLDIIAADDLAFIISELPENELMDSVYYKIASFKHFPRDVKFSYKAEVDFYYFRDIRKKQLRKYRYQILQKKWDRYLKEYISY